MVRLNSRQRGGLAALKLTKLFGIDDFPAAKDSGKVLIIIIYCYLIIITFIDAIYDVIRRTCGLLRYRILRIIVNLRKKFYQDLMSVHTRKISRLLT